MPSRRSDSACREKPRIERQVVGGLQQELLVVVEHVEAALEVGEADGHRLDALLVRQVLHPLLADLAGFLAGHAVGLGLDVHLLQLLVRDLEKVAKRRVHSSPLPPSRRAPGRFRCGRRGKHFLAKFPQFRLKGKQITLKTKVIALRAGTIGNSGDPSPAERAPRRVHRYNGLP
jgi:hypothetical protein